MRDSVWRKSQFNKVVNISLKNCISLKCEMRRSYITISIFTIITTHRSFMPTIIHQKKKKKNKIPSE